MSQLTADQQRFLYRDYGYHNSAQALDGGERADHLRRSMHSGAGPNRAWFETGSRGIGYSWPGEPRHPMAHRITWAELEAHRQSLPEALRVRLREALDANQAEWQRHWDASHAIAPNGYSRATDAQVAALGAEWARHMAADDATSAAVKSAVAAILPLGDGAPADLIEWAAVTG